MSLSVVGELATNKAFLSTGLSRETSVMVPALAALWLVPRKLTQSGRSLTLSLCCLPGQHLCVCVCVCVCVCLSLNRPAHNAYKFVMPLTHVSVCIVKVIACWMEREPLLSLSFVKCVFLVCFLWVFTTVLEFSLNICTLF